MVLTNFDYTVGWITALDIELAAAQAMLEEPFHPPLQQKAGDTNNYTLGCIGPHNVVIACLPSMGNNAAAFAAANLLRSFPNVRIGFMVGIGGGVPDHEEEDVRLGDIVVSNPDGSHGGVLQFDFGTAVQGQDFVQKGYLNKPPTALLTALKTLKAGAERKGYAFSLHYNRMIDQNPMMAGPYGRPDIDNLYTQSYEHPGSKANCSKCSELEIVHREDRTGSTVHYGLIGSSNQVIRDAIMRDRLHREQGIICFEMEAAGLMNDFPCLVIRGICDYCDTHKNKRWQRFASAQAAAFAKELLTHVSPIEIENTPIPTSIVDALDRQLAEHHSTKETVQKVLDKLEDVSKDDRRVLAMLKLTDPRMDKERLENIKGGLLKGSYLWILHNAEFRSWRDDSNQKLLWIRGDAGKGKTMLLCGIIEELTKEEILLSYFFCQQSHDRLRSATSILCGVVFMLAAQKPALIKHLRKYTDNSKDSIFEDHNAWFTLSTILKDCLKDEPTQEAIILVDALDECNGDDRQRLIYLIITCSRDFSAKWIVSSRNWPEIEKDLKFSEKAIISLELNAKSIAEAVKFYIEHRIALLAELQDYDDETQSQVTQYLLSNAGDTFLWVALACDHLQQVLSFETIKTLQLFPPGLNGLYGRMLERILESRFSVILLQILALTCLVYRPVNVEELIILLDVEITLSRSSKSVKELIGLCGSFLTIRKSDNCIILIHQSAKDFVLNEGYESVFFRGQQPLQRQIYSKSVAQLQLKLKRDIYSLRDPGTTIKDIAVPSPDPLENLNYSCVHWLNHYVACYDRSSSKELYLDDIQLVFHFFRTKFIFWLEASSLLRSMPIVTSALSELQSCFINSLSLLHCYQQGNLEAEQMDNYTQLRNLLEFVQDANQFVRFFQYALENFPLQVYVSGLLLSPAQSIIKELFKHEAPEWMQVRSGLSETWHPGSTLECSSTGNLLFSPSSERFATIDSVSNSLLCWNVASGRLLCSIQLGQNETDRYTEFSWKKHDTQLVVSRFPYVHVELWCIEDSRLLETIHFHEPEIDCMEAGSKRHFPNVIAEFSADGLLFAHFKNGTLTIYDISSRELKISWDWKARQPKLAFSPDSLHIAICSSKENTTTDTCIWDIETGSLLQELASHSQSLGLIHRCVFSRGGELLAVFDASLNLWNWSKGQLLLTLSWEASGTWLHSKPVAFNPSSGNMIFLTPTTLQEWHSDGSISTHDRVKFPNPIDAIACSPNGQLMATTVYHSSVTIWNASPEKNHEGSLHALESYFYHLYLRGNTIITLGESLGEDKSFEIHVRNTSMVVGANTSVVGDFKPALFSISPDRHFVAISSSESDVVQIWDIRKEVIPVITIKTNETTSEILAIGWHSEYNSILLTTSDRKWLTCWSTETGKLLQKWILPRINPFSVNFCSSPKDGYVAMSSYNDVNILRVSDNIWQNLAKGARQSSWKDQTVFSKDERLFAYVNEQYDLLVWNITTFSLLATIPKHGLSCLLSIDDHWLKTYRGWYRIPVDLQLGEPFIPLEAPQINMEMDIRSPAWIRLDERNLVWLPGVYRPSEYKYWDIEGDRIAIGLGYKVLILDFLR